MSERRPAGQNGAPSTSNTQAECTAPNTVGYTLVGDTAWVTRARAALEALAATGEPFGADDLREVCDSEPAHPTLWGSMFRGAHLRGVIRPVGITASRRRPHKSTQIWRGAK